MLQYDVVVVTPLQENCSLVWCDATNKAALIDPGGDTNKILAFLEGKNVELERILITHTHFDHVGAAADLAEKFNIPIEGSHADDEFLVEALPHQGAMFGYPAVRPYTPDIYFQQGDKIQIGETELNVHHCPGHTPGHIAFSNQEAKIAFVGDVLFKGSVGRTDFERGDHNALLRSIKEQLLPLGDYFSFVPGHGPNSTFGVERVTNPYIIDIV